MPYNGRSRPAATSLARVVAFVVKDFQDALNSQTLTFLLLVPVLISVFFSQLSGDKIRRPRVAINDNNSVFARALKLSGNLQVLDSISNCREESDFRRKIENKILDAVIIIPPGFDEELKQNNFPRIDIYLGNNTAQNNVVKESVKSSLRRFAGQELPADIYAKSIFGNDDSESAEKSILCIWICFTAIAGLMITASTFVEEKEHKTINAVLMSPAKYWEIAAGHLVSVTVMPLLSALLIVIINQPENISFAVILLITLGSSVFAAGGIVLGQFAKSQTAANAMSSAIYLLLFIPLVMADFNDSIHKFCYILPTYYLNNGLYGAIADGNSFSALLKDIYPLSAILAVLLLIVGKNLRIRL